MLGVLLLSGLLLNGLLVLVGTTPALAHENALTSSWPAASETLTVPPQRITLSFRWRVRPGSMTVTVLGPDQITQWQRDRPTEVSNTVGVDLRELLVTGRYEVHYHGVSLRGHPFQGMMDFVLAPRILAHDSGGSKPPPIWIAGTVLLTMAAAAVGIRLGQTGL
jgi:methionine-rich copper-binding protein CopC